MLYSFINRRTRDLSPLGVVRNEGFEQCRDLLLLRARES
jgi:hypothetical protein